MSRQKDEIKKIKKQIEHLQGLSVQEAQRSQDELGSMGRREWLGKGINALKDYLKFLRDDTYSESLEKEFYSYYVPPWKQKEKTLKKIEDDIENLNSARALIGDIARKRKINKIIYDLAKSQKIILMRLWQQVTKKPFPQDPNYDDDLGYDDDDDF